MFKIQVNKIINWQRADDCLPSLGRLVMIQSKSDQYTYIISELQVDGDGEIIFMPMSDDHYSLKPKDVKKWTYVKL